MGLFHGVNINEQVSLREGSSNYWSFRLDHTCPIRLYVEQIDGYGINIYVMRDEEYRNWARGKVFRYIANLSYENVGTFENTEYLDADSYYLVAELPQIREGRESYAVAAVRCETLE